jgi:hypothetical protein
MKRPQHLQPVREFLVVKWGAELTDGYEADDAIGIGMSSGSTVCCSLDKDLKQLPGEHYNWVKDEWDAVSEVEGWRHFYKQLLTGDKSDNIPGIRGIGKVRAARLIEPCNSAYLMFSVVRGIYADEDTLIRNARLLYVWRKENDQYKPPTKAETTCEARPEEVAKLESILTTRVETTPSTGRGGTKRKKSGSRVHGQPRDSRSKRNSRDR